MGNIVSSSVNKVFHWLEEKGVYIHNLENNLVALETTMEDLKAKREDLTTRLRREEDRGRQRLVEVQVWLDRVNNTENKVNGILSDRDVELQRLCLCGVFSMSLMSSYQYGKNVLLTLKEVEKLKSDVFGNIAEKALTPEVEERQLQPTIVGQETMLQKAWNHLMEDGVGVMGIYGMGGVGKTTLLTQINNKFSNDRCGYDYVIWVVVSKELQVEKILDEIAQKLDLGGEQWNRKNMSQKVDVMYNFLRKKRFVLFLDDIWEKVDLAEIGVPFPTTQNRCKVAFTTRKQDVCAYMRVEHSIEVECLANDDAFDLFQKKVGIKKLGSDPEILDLAKRVANKCCGLPLALNVIGETMSCKKTIQEWRHAIDVLTSYAIEFSGMEDKILPLLKYSYDSLKGEQIKSCLLYCALFPEDNKISKERLVEYWICEGIIDGSEDIEKAENTGYDIIGSLVGASLLMELFVFDEDENALVSMHDVVREMALWIASGLGKQKEAFIVCAGVGLREIPKVKNWNLVRRMSLMNNKIQHLVGSPECLELTTLLLQYTRLTKISSAFFKNMPKLAVLDLSRNLHISELPEEIANLVSLQYLNLSDTRIRHLPKGLHELKKLIHLDLESTSHLQNIAGISSLRNLKVLKLAGSGFLYDCNTVKELESLEHLEILTTRINRPSLPNQFLSSHRLISRTRSLQISADTTLESFEISLPEHVDKLRDFIIRSCSIPEIKMGKKCSFLSLVKVSIEFCECLRELTFLMFAPNLGFLYVVCVNELEDIINKEKAREVENSGIVPFQKLNHLRLALLPKLRNICWSHLPFPYLKEIMVRSCPNLKKLPLDSKSGTHGENGLVNRHKIRSEGMD